ncbi:carotenoid oxygenase family protein [Legionella sp. km772]|uniref:carotenoid oxygenase family protein n=1 Tax=Legionella sp. km772 TaxID=2498111 RepID=UPI000F8F77E2|nr:carotenoid oxygenase family protein [Legionella sp. km772]RUR06060.1 carotenoid oxygenase family protein [Legionella sp. km772]
MNSKQENPYLLGNYAPVDDELVVAELKVFGEIPRDLCGIYMRNGPNPQFPPISYTYPYDGDGMVHALYINNGKVSYRNRYIETKSLLKERQAGKALYGGLLKLIPMDPQWAGPEDEPIAVKNGAFIHIIRHGNTYLALSEGAPAYQMTAQLDTLGEWSPTAPKALDLCAHTRLDPLTGELWFINYALLPPFLTVYQFDKQGLLKNKWNIEKEYSSMFHDFVLTQNYVILFDCPSVFDFKQLMKGGPVLNWQPELGTRIGIMPRHGGPIKWIRTEPFFVFHFANAYEQDKQIIIDYVRHEQLVMLTQEDNHKPPSLYSTTINLVNDSIHHQAIDNRIVEFPRIREDRNSRPHQFIYCLSKTRSIANPRAMNVLLQYDRIKNSTQVRTFSDETEIGEAVFAPASQSQNENEGYLMLLAYNSTTNHSEFLILNANQLDKEPLAKIQLPRRIPNGLHGSWMPGPWE